MCITDWHDVTLAVKVAINPNTTNPSKHFQMTHQMRLIKRNLLFEEFKSLLERQKVLITSIYFFSYNIFKDFFFLKVVQTSDFVV